MAIDTSWVRDLPDDHLLRAKDRTSRRGYRLIAAIPFTWGLSLWAHAMYGLSFGVWLALTGTWVVMAGYGTFLLWLSTILADETRRREVEADWWLNRG